MTNPSRAALADKIKIVLSGETPLTGEVCKHGYDLVACPSRECKNPYAMETLLEEAETLLRAPGRLDCGELASHLDRIANKQLGLTSDIAAVKKAAKILRALPPTLNSGAVREALEDRQRIVIEWGERCFGIEHMLDVIVRAARFFEEAAELVQSAGLPRDHAQRAFDHVYSRPAGEPAQEVGGVANTLMALCGTLSLSFDDCQRAEIERCLAKDPSHFAKRNEAKLREVDALALPRAVEGGAVDDAALAKWHREWHWADCVDKPLDLTTYPRDLRMLKAFVRSHPNTGDGK